MGGVGQGRLRRRGRAGRGSRGHRRSDPRQLGYAVSSAGMDGTASPVSSSPRPSPTREGLCETHAGRSKPVNDRSRPPRSATSGSGTPELAGTGPTRTSTVAFSMFAVGWIPTQDVHGRVSANGHGDIRDFTFQRECSGSQPVHHVLLLDGLGRPNPAGPARGRLRPLWSKSRGIEVRSPRIAMYTAGFGPFAAARRRPGRSCRTVAIRTRSRGHLTQRVQPLLKFNRRGLHRVFPGRWPAG